MRVGDLAPDFTAPRLDGGPFQMSETRGKLVLLDFWATWCWPCRAEVPAMKDIQKTFGGDPRFLLVGVSCDDAAEAPAKYTRENCAGLDSGARRKDARRRGRDVSRPGDPGHVPDRSRRPRPGHEPPRAGTQGGCPKRLERPKTVPHREVDDERERANLERFTLGMRTLDTSPTRQRVNPRKSLTRWRFGLVEVEARFVSSRARTIREAL